ncbi:cilia- and flagella-associated protein 58-like [Stegodyphus dumicola]|uniref:cilia- and flagella-associated protein 58-like n=1 Tax=Stegodyphus dumicola TaxID=202533 RepID=UPI0015B17D1A|nr:cilia- and flagella-associated protein 58-like [Stegodyphus dumicola]
MDQSNNDGEQQGSCGEFDAVPEGIMEDEDDEHLMVELQCLKREQNELSRKLQILEDKGEALKAQSEKFRQEAYVKEGDLSLLQKNHSENMNMIDILEKQIKKLRTDYRFTEAVLKSRTASLETAKKQSAAYVKANEVLKEQIREFEQKLEHKQRERDDLLFKANTLEVIKADQAEKISELEQKSSQFEVLMAGLKKQLEKESSKNQQIWKVAEANRLECREAKRDLEVALNQTKTLSKRTTYQLQVIRSLQDQVKKFRNCITKFNIDIKTSKSVAKQWEEVNKNLAMELSCSQKRENDFLKKIAERNNELELSKHKIDNLIEEKNTLSSKCQELQSEVNIRNEKIQLREQDTTKLQQLLSEKTETLNTLLKEVEKLRCSQISLAQKNNEIKLLRNELNGSERLLQMEQIKCKALEEEFKKPHNIHRWRALEGTDPSRAQLVLKNLSFQKVLRNKCKKLENLDKELKEKEDLIEELRDVIRKQADSKPEKLWTCKKELQECNKKICSLSAEVGMYETLCGKYEKENGQLREELQKLKKLDYERKLKLREL